MCNLLLLFVIVLLVIILILSYKIYIKTNNNIVLCDKDKDFIIFTIDMYIKYAVELDIYDKENHDVISQQLEKIKKRLNHTK